MGSPMEGSKGARRVVELRKRAGRHPSLEEPIPQFSPGGEFGKGQLNEPRQFVKKQAGLEREVRMLARHKEAAERRLEELNQVIEEQSRSMALMASKIALLSKRSKAQEALTAAVRDQLIGQHEELQTALYELESAHAVSQTDGLELSKRIHYHQVIRRVRDVVRNTLPRDATLLVVSKGDDALLKLFGRKALHFPQTEDGVYSGHHPANSTAAIVQLETLRARGAGYLLFPQPAFWWLDHYVEFREHLERRYPIAAQEPECCLIFSLRGAADGGAAVRAQFEELIEEYRSRLDRDPSILDWNSGLDLAAAIPQEAVFSPPPMADSTLPYLDHSIDIVVTPFSDPGRIAEARRVVQGAVVTLGQTESAGQLRVHFRVEWRAKGSAAPRPALSIVIACHNGWHYTEACLTSLRETVARGFQGEIILVDDASSDGTARRLKQLAKADARFKIVHNRKNMGFIAACNRGAAAASGEILIFLNNDTVLLPGWLAPLVRTFRDHPDAGAVGGKLVFPDGRLQEAGGIVFCDGSAAHFGRGDYDIEAPSYEFVRDVDYCSAALLATPRALFRELGGFDRRYRPAYYEDADYCFQVRQRGYCVYYQPRSTIVHFEGGTSGVDLTRGVKRFQAVNQRKFLEKWRAVLKRQPKRPSYSDQAAWKGLLMGGAAPGEEENL